jgi:hypothetical protein
MHLQNRLPSPLRAPLHIDFSKLMADWKKNSAYNGRTQLHR